MRLVHYSKSKIPKLVNRKPPNDTATIGYKPFGFWVSDEDDYGWRQWCEGENFAQNDFNYEYEVSFTEDANILYITTLKELEDFHAEYSILNPIWEKVETYKGRKDCINWGLVKEKHDGIVITPYRWERRLAMDFMWYYGWDCASGCIWNYKTIKLKECEK